MREFPEELLSPKELSEALKVLYPSRYTTNHHTSNLIHYHSHGQSSSSSHSLASGVSGGGTCTQRFSQLLLEHGECEVQDWAVVASSSVLEGYDETSSHCHGTRKDINSSSASTSTSAGKPKKRKSRRRHLSSSSSKSKQDDGRSTKPCTRMKSVAGRLRLCTKSIVFEPNDVSRGILRYPMDKLVGAPQSCDGILVHSSSSLPEGGDSNGGLGGVGGGVGGGGGYAAVGGMNAVELSPLSNGDEMGGGSNEIKSKVVSIKAKRVICMKAKNIVAPYETIDIPTHVKFTFLHSTTQPFLNLIRQIYDIWQTKNTQSDCTTHHTPHNHEQHATKAMDALLRPMLDRPFDPCNFCHVWEVPQTNNIRSTLLGPLVSQEGCTVVTRQYLYFQPSTNGVCSNSSSFMAPKALSWKLDSVVAYARRYRGLQDCALELFLESEDCPPVLLAFESVREREQIISLLPQWWQSRRSGSGRHRVVCHTNPEFVACAYDGWRNGSIDNFEYLLALNSAAGRSCHDLSRYPVFPWVLANYSTTKLDWSIANDFSSTNGDSSRRESASQMFRDLSKPIGALNQDRLEGFQERMKSIEEDMDPAFLYGTHYSAPGYCLYYLVRTMPEQMLCLQNGKYDTPDRLFHAIDQCYSSVLNNAADVKESIPHFFDPKSGVDLLLNLSGLQLGVTQKGKLVNDVKLPKWAKSPKDFLKKNRKALESEYCTHHLPFWIDLIFGEKSRGEKAVDAMNLFHPTSYLGPKDVENLATVEEQAQAELQATEFGICPDMLFCEAHPQRGDGIASKDFLILNNGRAMFIEDGAAGNTNAWEILDNPKAEPSSRSFDQGLTLSVGLGTKRKVVRQASPSKSPIKVKATPSSDVKTIVQHEHSDDKKEESSVVSTVLQNDSSGSLDQCSTEDSKTKSIQLSGTGDSSHGDNWTIGVNGAFGDEFKKVRMNGHTKASTGKYSSSTPPTQEENVEGDVHLGWDMTHITTKQIHGHTVSGCCLSVGENPLVTTTSLDGGLMVHTLPNSNTDSGRRRGFKTGSPNRRRVQIMNKETRSMQLHSFRSHTSSDPLACLALVDDGFGGQIVFAGGHDDVVLAYGIRSACALASVYSHRDAISGLVLLDSPHFSQHGTHTLISGSWDATVKVWVVTVSEGESVLIEREPFAELYDADSPVVSVSAIDVAGAGRIISAGCSDGSLVIWLWVAEDGFDASGIKVIYQEEARRDDSSCTAIQWRSNTNSTKHTMFAGFANGSVASYVCEGESVRPMSKLNIGSPVHCISIHDGFIFVGCADGGLRLIPVGSDGLLDYNPQVWKALHGQESPALTSISVSHTSNGDEKDQAYFTCATGAEDGTVTISQFSRQHL